MKKFFIGIWALLFVGVVVLVVASDVVTPEVRDRIFKEGTGVELISACCYFIAGFLLLIQSIVWFPQRWSLCVIVLCCGMRELDFDKRFSTMGVFKSRSYMSPDVPFYEKLIGVMVIAALLITIFFMLKKYFRQFLKEIWAKGFTAINILISASALALAKSLDGFRRKLKPLGIEVSDQVSNLASATEESLEVAGALLILILVMASFPKRSAATDRS